MKKATEKEREEIEREMKENPRRHVRLAVNPQRGFGC